VLDRGAYWRHLANKTELSMSGGDVALLSNYLDYLLLVVVTTKTASLLVSRNVLRRSQLQSTLLAAAAAAFSDASLLSLPCSQPPHHPRMNSVDDTSPMIIRRQVAVRSNLIDGHLFLV